MMKYPFSLKHWLLAAGMGISAIACAQLQALPTERTGVAGKELSAIRLPVDLDFSKGRILRMREVTIQPGGFLPSHSHADRPSVSYVLKGELTEYVEGESSYKQLTAGQAYATHGEKGHALQNRGDVPAVFLEIDLPSSGK